MKNLPMEEVYNKYIKGLTIEKLSEEYNTSQSAISKKLRKYANENNLNIKADRKKNKIDMELIYEMHKSGISCYDIAELFNCSYRTIFRRLHDYCDEFNLPLDRKTKGEQIKEKVSIMYEEYIKGSSINELGKKYNCHQSMIQETLKSYCNETGKEMIYHRGRKKITLQEEELFNKYLEKASLKILAEEYGCGYDTLRKKLEEYVGKESWKICASHMRGRGQKNKEINLDDMKMPYREAFIETIKQIIIKKEHEIEENAKIKSLGGK